MSFTAASEHSMGKRPRQRRSFVFFFFLFLFFRVLPEFYYLGLKILLNKMLLKPNPGLVRLVKIMSYY